LGTWRCCHDSDDRAEAEHYARTQVRFGGAVTAIELRERGKDSVVIWKAGD
jgi:hypothetical protein